MVQTLSSRWAGFVLALALILIAVPLIVIGLNKPAAEPRLRCSTEEPRRAPGARQASHFTSHFSREHREDLESSGTVADVLECSRMFSNVLECSRMFANVRECSRMFSNVRELEA